MERCKMSVNKKNLQKKLKVWTDVFPPLDSSGADKTDLVSVSSVRRQRGTVDWDVFLSLPGQSPNVYIDTRSKPTFSFCLLLFSDVL